MRMYLAKSAQISSSLKYNFRYIFVSTIAVAANLSKHTGVE